jgi:hypothetical protein
MSADVSNSRRIEFTILAQCASLKNSRQIVPVRQKHGETRGGSKCPYCGQKQWLIPVPSEEARVFQAHFKKQLPAEACVGWDMPVGVEISIYYRTNQSDLDEAIVLDMMQACGVIKNDRQVVSKFVQKFIDPESPRVIVAVVPVLWNRNGKQAGIFTEDQRVNPLESIA